MRRDYDRGRRDEVAKAFYNSRAWKSIRQVKLSSTPLCEPCQELNVLRPATTVHHIKPARDFPELRLSIDNLESNCESCHSSHHARER
jgi:5-methylcytosine-specific restriction protein A